MIARDKKWRTVAIGLAAIGLLAATASTLPIRRQALDSRTIVVVAENMMFNSTNPTIVVAPGEMIRLVFRNEDAGMKHDLAIPELGIRTGVLEPGETAVLEFRAPEKDFFEYLCSLHPVSMRGFFAVAGPGEGVADLSSAAP